MPNTLSKEHQFFVKNCSLAAIATGDRASSLVELRDRIATIDEECLYYHFWGGQRGAHIAVQKSTREGFGLTVTESLWKSKPVIGGNCGGIRLQVINYHTGFLVDTPEGAAERIRYLLQSPHLIPEMGEKGHRFVYENFLITRHLRDYLTLIISLLNPSHGGRIEIHKMGL